MKRFLRFRSKPYSAILVLVLFISMAGGRFKMLHEKDFSNLKEPVSIAWDVYGYYMYLPSTFIYHDTYLEKKEWVNAVREKYNPSSSEYQFRAIRNKSVNIYLCGHAIIWAPGFFIAHLLAEPLGYAADGFSLPYQLSLIITGMLVTLLGLVFLRKVLLHFFTDKITALCLLIIGFGTNYYFHGGLDGTGPHNIIFSL